MSQNQEIIESKLCAYIDGELDPEGRAEIEKHLEANPQHRRLLESLRATRDLLRWLPREPAPPELAETLNGQLERSVLLDYDGESLRPRIVPRILAAAAIVILTAGLAAAVFFALPKSRRNAQIAASTGADQFKQTDSASTGGRREGERETQTGYADSAPGSTERGQASESPDDAKAKADPALDQMARDVAANSDTIVAAANGVSNTTESAVPAINNSVVMLVRADKPEAAQKELTEYLSSNQIQWRAADAPQQAGGVGPYALAARTHPDEMPTAAASNPAQSGQLESPHEDRNATTQPAEAGRLSQLPAFAASQPAQGLTPIPAQVPDASAMLANRSRTNNLFVARMSRSQAQALSTVMNRQGNQAAQLKDATEAWRGRGDGVPNGPAAGASTQPAADGRDFSAAFPPRDLLQKTAAQQVRSAAPTTRPTVDLIEVGDELRLVSTDDKKAAASEKEQTVRVGQDGTVTLPSIGIVRCAGLTTEQANQLIAKTVADRTPAINSKSAAGESSAFRIDRIEMAQKRQAPETQPSLVADAAQFSSVPATEPTAGTQPSDDALNVVIVVEPSDLPQGAFAPTTQPDHSATTQPSPLAAPAH